MEALHKKAPGCENEKKEGNQEPRRHLEVIPQDDNIDIYFLAQRQKEIKSINESFKRWESEKKPRLELEHKALMDMFAERARIQREGPCEHCNAYCDKKHYGGEEKKDRFREDPWYFAE